MLQRYEKLIQLLFHTIIISVTVYFNILLIITHKDLDSNTNFKMCMIDDKNACDYKTDDMRI